jgi:hypothetical protein
MNELDERITEMPATTMEGMVAKARCAKVYDEDCRPDGDDPLSMFGASIVRDLLAMATTAAWCPRFCSGVSRPLWPDADATFVFRL